MGGTQGGSVDRGCERDGVVGCEGREEVGEAD